MGDSWLDIGGLKGGQDEGHLSATRGQLGQEVILCSESSASFDLRSQRISLVRRHLQRDHLKAEESSHQKQHETLISSWAGRQLTLSRLLLPLLLQQVLAAVFETLHGYTWDQRKSQLTRAAANNCFHQ